MARFEVQGIVSTKNGLPFVQLRQLNNDGTTETRLQVSPDEAREIAQNILEAATNAVYDGALIAWAKEAGLDDNKAVAIVTMIRKFRADKWGLPDRPEDWRIDESSI